MGKISIVSMPLKSSETFFGLSLWELGSLERIWKKSLDETLRSFVSGTPTNTATQMRSLELTRKEDKHGQEKTQAASGSEVLIQFNLRENIMSGGGGGGSGGPCAEVSIKAADVRQARHMIEGPIRANWLTIEPIIDYRLNYDDGRRLTGGFKVRWTSLDNSESFTREAKDLKELNEILTPLTRGVRDMAAAQHHQRVKEQREFLRRQLKDAETNLKSKDAENESRRAGYKDHVEKLKQQLRELR